MKRNFLMFFSSGALDYMDSSVAREQSFQSHCIMECTVSSVFRDNGVFLMYFSEVCNFDFP